MCLIKYPRLRHALYLSCVLLTMASTVHSEMRMLDLSSIANTSSIDDLAGDFKNFTDQGPDNDLRALKPGILKLPEVEFTLLDPKQNGGRNIVMTNSYFCWFYPQKKITLPVPSMRMRTLFLLHTSAWMPGKGAVIGVLNVRYKDETEDNFDVVGENDLGDWQYPRDFPNGRMAWRSLDAENFNHGIFYSAYPIQDKEVESISFLKGKSGTWIVLAATGLDTPFTFPEIAPVQVRRGDDFRPFAASREVKRGSILDFSFMNHRPAGKFGPIENRNGLLYPRDSDEPIRFYGTNLCMSGLFLSHEEADTLAERLAALGYNSLRIHHYDPYIAKTDANGNFVIDESKRDQLDYLVYAMKKRGIYLVTELYNSREPDLGKLHKFCPEIKSGRDYKCAVQFYPEVRNDLKDFARAVFKHVNPYTGMTWGEDPAFLYIGMVNEDSLIVNVIKYIGLCSGPLKKRFEKDFEEDCARKGIAITPETRLRLYTDYLSSVFVSFYQDMHSFMRNELGVKCLISDQNSSNETVYPENRMRLDFLDTHAYWDHPNFPSWYTHNISIIRSRHANFGSWIAPRLEGKPMFMTESDFVYPNTHRSEEGLAYGAYLAFQGFSGIWHFAYSHNVDALFQRVWIDWFDSVNDPVKWMSERIAMLFLRRGDIKAPKRSVVVVIPKGKTTTIPATASKLQAHVRLTIAYHNGNGDIVPPLPADSIAVYSLDPSLDVSRLNVPTLNDNVLSPVEKLEAILGKKLSDGRFLTTEDGQIVTDLATHSMKAVTPRHESFVLPEGVSATGDFLSVENPDSFCSISAASMDGHDLNESRRILLFHITNVEAEGMTFADNTFSQVVKYTKNPPLGKRGTARFRLPARAKTLYALDLDGTRLDEISLEEDQNGKSFIANTVRFANHLVFAYELICE